MGVLGEIRLYDFVLFVHIAAVVVAFGPTFAYPFFQTVVERVSPRSVPAMLQAMHTTSRYLVTPGLLVVLASGIYLTVDGWDFGQRFVVVGLAVVVVLIVLGATFFDRHEARLIELSKRDVAAVGAREGVLSADYWVVSKRFARVGVAASLLIVVALFFMAVKP
ncbi:MAG: DUF2269 family protein [Actinomycetota bacterium]|nr:DUF2269 family protein [Actinomycetota bacterium]